jgi:hypothetical protein
VSASWCSSSVVVVVGVEEVVDVDVVEVVDHGNNN